MKKEESAKFLKLCLADALLKLMRTQNYHSVSVSEVCRQAGVGRTTFYRYFDRKSGKEELLVFKLVSEWEGYRDRHRQDAGRDDMAKLLDFAYENRELFRLMYQNGLTTAIMQAFDRIPDQADEKGASYLRAFFVYGCFGVIYQWIKYDFDQTPGQIMQQTSEAILRAVKRNEAEKAAPQP